MNEVQDELDYQELIAKVAMIDKDAAEYMQGPMREIEGFKLSDDMWCVVMWSNTLQGPDYWYDIACKLKA